MLFLNEKKVNHRGKNQFVKIKPKNDLHRLKKKILIRISTGIQHGWIYYCSDSGWNGPCSNPGRELLGSNPWSLLPSDDGIEDCLEHHRWGIPPDPLSEAGGGSRGKRRPARRWPRTWPAARKVRKIRAPEDRFRTLPLPAFYPDIEK